MDCDDLNDNKDNDERENDSDENHFVECKDGVYSKKYLFDDLFYTAVKGRFNEFVKLVEEIKSYSHNTENPLEWKNDEGNTLLHLVAEAKTDTDICNFRRLHEVCKYIIAQINDVNPTNSNGDTPMDFAFNAGNTRDCKNTIAYLISTGGKFNTVSGINIFEHFNRWL